MAVCGCCLQEMTDSATVSCEHDPDVSILPTEEELILLARFDQYDAKKGLPTCHDCGVAPGGTHHPGCDVERCSVCSAQAISGCEHTYDAQPGAELHDASKARWTGVWPGILEAIRLGLFCWENPGRKNGLPWWVPCGPNHPKAIVDLNAYASFRAGRLSEGAITKRREQFL